MRSALLVFGLMACVVALPSSADVAAEPEFGPRQARIFGLACAHCHARPGTGAPLLGDDEAWAPRRAQGLESMLANTVTGVGNMPPLGTCGFCTEADLRLLVQFLSGLAGDATERGS